MNIIQIMSKDIRFEQTLNDKKKVIIYGGGFLGRAIAESNLCKIECFCDKRADEIGEVNGVEVILPENLKELEGEFKILITSIGNGGEAWGVIEDIQQELLKLELKAKTKIEVYNIIEHTEYMEKGIISGSAPVVIDPFKYIHSGYANVMKCYKSEHKDSTYFSKIFPPVEAVSKNEESIQMADYYSELFNIRDGRRVTLPKNIKYFNSIHMFGDSRVLGMGVEDEMTISTLLQKKILKVMPSTKLMKVINYGVTSLPGFGLMHMFYQLKNSNVKKGDKVAFLTHFCLSINTLKDVKIFVKQLRNIKDYCIGKGVEFCYVNLPFITEKKILNEGEKAIKDLYRLWYEKYNIDKMESMKMLLKEELERNQIVFNDFLKEIKEIPSSKQIFYDYCHYGDYGNELISEYLFDILGCREDSEILKAIVELDKKYSNEMFILNYDDEIDKYIDSLRNKIPEKAHKIGMIVVNCNPFTKGHQYLIEMAYRQVDFLIISVLEENKSFFSYEERIELVQKNTCHYENVVVVRSSKFIISSLTFPEYFNKDYINYEIDAVRDILIFCTKIAKKLNIKKRFVGEEPFCKVTKQYNQQMKQILPLYQIEFVEIPRKKSPRNGKEISASEVRRLIEREEWDKIEDLVPKETYEFIMSKYRNKGV